MKLTLFIISIFMCVCGNTQSQKALLNKAYKTESDSLLNKFFNNWHNEYDAHPDSLFETKDSLKRSAHQIFKMLYDPTHLDKIGYKGHDKNMYDSVEYLIIQNYINLYTTDIIYFNEVQAEKYMVDRINSTVKSEKARALYLEKKDGKFAPRTIERFHPNNGFYIYIREIEKTPLLKIENFRPTLNIENKKCVYLTSKYSKILTNFMGSTYKRSTADTEGRDLKKYADTKEGFLERKVHIIGHHWDKNWHLESFPKIYSITFDKEFQYARADFRIEYGGGSAILKRKGNSWEMIGAHNTWSE
ncbi:hypothetical protein K6119_01935 [Paracrocinitomix mangrovi]|uniref:hypothetical protein n=1 Tax=Paracrocinitomix mangrovi TaxID=2862509 RepID=UPI001C8D8078|nr:hypothetical protein [Paracrocinitomix mangrovi]UKN02278.1 hypothetical protein K6119_01935 [Paracrocinitomix mangrovi]